MNLRTCPQPAAHPSAEAPAAALAGLMASVARGDERAFALLHDAIAAPVYGIALRTLHSPAHAEEVAQEVLLEVWRTAAAYRPDRGAVLTWVLTIAHRRAVDRVRSVRAAAEREVRVAVRDRPVEESVAELAERTFDARRVRSALALLSPAQRESLVLAYYGGYSQREISLLLGLPLGTVKTRMRDGLRRLRAGFEDADRAFRSDRQRAVQAPARGAGRTLAAAHR